MYKPAPEKPETSLPSRLFRIMSFDGGPSATSYLTCLREVVQHNPLLFSKTNMFAGTSDGALLSLYLASRTAEELHDGKAIVDQLLDINTQFLKLFSSSKRFFRALFGYGTLLDPGPVRQFLEQDHILGNKTVSDLHHYFAIVTFRLFSIPEDIESDGPSATTSRWFRKQAPIPPRNSQNELYRPWGAHVYHNLFPSLNDFPPYTNNGHEPYYKEIQTRYDQLYHANISTPFRETKLIDLVFRSSSTPMFLPIYQGFVDGAFFANNPSMAAVGVALENRRWINARYNREAKRTRRPLAVLRSTKDILVLSFGKDDRSFVEDPLNDKWHDLSERKAHIDPSDPKDSYEPWGYLSWLFRIPKPLRLFDLLFSKDGRGVSDQCMQVLSFTNYFRLSLMKHSGFVDDFFKVILWGNMKKVQKEADLLAEEWKQEDCMQSQEDSLEKFLRSILEKLEEPTMTSIINTVFPEPPPAFVYPLQDSTPSSFTQLLLHQMNKRQYNRSTAYKNIEFLNNTILLFEHMAATIVDESSGEQELVKHRINRSILKGLEYLQMGWVDTDTDSNPDPQTKELSIVVLLESVCFLGAMLKEMQKVNDSKTFSTTYLYTTLWTWTRWMMHETHTLTEENLWTLAFDPYFHVPMLHFFHEVEDLNIPNLLQRFQNGEDITEEFESWIQALKQEIPPTQDMVS